MPKLKPISVSIRATRDFVRGLKSYAASEGTTVADLTKKAIDQTYGAQIESHLSFFRQPGYLNSHEPNSLDKSAGPGAA